MKLKYIMESRGHWLYQRRFPRRLAQHPQVQGKPTYRKALGVTTDAPEAQLLKAWESANTAFESYIDTLESANIDQLSQAAKILKAEALLKTKGLTSGLLHKDPSLTPDQQDALFDDALLTVEHSGALDNMFYSKRAEGVAMTPQEEIEGLAWKLLHEPKRNTGTSVPLLSDCWAHYATAKEIDVKTREGRRKHKMWLEFLSLSGGDTVMTQENTQLAIETYVDAMLKRDVTGSTVDTWTRKNLAILRHTIKKTKQRIVLEKPSIVGATDYEDDYVLIEKEELALIKTIRSGALEPYKAAVLSLMLEAGCIPSEVQRLEPFNVHIETTGCQCGKDHPVPHLILKNKKMKTKARARVLVPVATLDIIKIGMADTGWTKFQQMSDSNVSHQLKTILKKIAPQATSRSLRHGCRNRLMAAGIPLDAQALIGGWTSGVNMVQLGYGRAGVTNDRTLKMLHQAMIEINGAFIGKQSSVILPFNKGKTF